MEQLLIRGLPDGFKATLKARAQQNHRSAEAEARAILTAAAASPSPVLAWLDQATTLRRECGGLELPEVERAASREVPPL